MARSREATAPRIHCSVKENSQPQGEGKQSLLESALAYAAQGILVFPLVPGTKNPFKDSGGFKDATRDPAIIRQWWTATPDANIGIRTGSESGFFVLDDDRYKDKDALVSLQRRYGELPETRTVQTPRNGRHFYFAYPEGRKVPTSSTRLGSPALEIRGDGAYVVASPSVFEGNRYKVVIGIAPVNAPDWLLDLIASQPDRGDRGDEGTDAISSSPSLCPSVHPPHYPLADNTIEAAVRAALPDQEHTNHVHLFILARGTIGLSVHKRVMAFNKWFEIVQAKGLLREGQGRDQYLAEYLAAAKTARIPLGQGVAEKAWELAGTNPFPPEAEVFETPQAKQIVAVCFQLEQLSRGEPWFFPCRVLARLAGIPRMSAANFISALVCLGVLKVVQEHTKVKGTRYRYVKR